MLRVQTFTFSIQEIDLTYQGSVYKSHLSLCRRRNSEAVLTWLGCRRRQWRLLTSQLHSSPSMLSASPQCLPSLPSCTLRHPTDMKHPTSPHWKTNQPGPMLQLNGGKNKWNKYDIAVGNQNHHTTTGNQIPYGITKCYPAGNFPTFTPAEVGTRFSNAGKMQGWVDLGGGYITR